MKLDHHCKDGKQTNKKRQKNLFFEASCINTKLEIRPDLPQTAWESKIWTNAGYDKDREHCKYRDE